MREYIDGESLRSKLDDEDPIRSITFVHQVLAAVGEAISVVQTNIEDDLDINPEHILIQPIASGLRSHPSHEYKIMVSPDTVRVSALVRELNHKAVAKLIYSPPECLRDSSCGEASRDWANQYRLGIIGYEMLVGSSAFSRMARERSEILVKFREDHTAADLPELPAIASLCPRGCPQFLRQPVERMTRMRPEERFRTLSEAVSAVAHLDFEVEVALDSYNRIVSDVTSEWNFFKKFYDRFLTECPSAAGEFHRFPPIRPSLGDPGSSQFERSWPDQYRKLKHAIVALFTFKLVGKSDGVTILTGIADFHVGYPEEYYSAFRQALLKTVEECDNIERSGLLPERLRAAWAKAVDPGIEYMVAHTKERARSAGR